MQEITRVDEIPGTGAVLLYLYTTEIKDWAAASLAKLVRKNPTIRFVRTTVDVPSEINDEYSVSRVPAFMFLRDRELIWSYCGADINHLTSLFHEPLIP